MDLPRIASWAANTPWAISEDKLVAIAMALAVRIQGVGADSSRIASARSKRRQGDQPLQQDLAGNRQRINNSSGTPGGETRSITILPIYGTICPRMHQLEDGSGGISCERIGLWLQQAANDAKVGGIVLDIDSPGGSAFGVAELAAQIRAVNATKPVMAIANHEACSAAWWLASAAGEVGMTSSAIVGSQGVYMIHQSFAKALEQEGVETTMIQAGQFKLIGNPFAPLDDTAKAKLQEWVDRTYSKFTADVASYRGKSEQYVKEHFGQGWILHSDNARKVGMVDRVGNFDELVNDFASRVLTPVKSNKAAAASRQRDIEIARAKLAISENVR